MSQVFSREFREFGKMATQVQDVVDPHAWEIIFHEVEGLQGVWCREKNKIYPSIGGARGTGKLAKHLKAKFPSDGGLLTAQLTYLLQVTWESEACLAEAITLAAIQPEIYELLSPWVGYTKYPDGPRLPIVRTSLHNTWRVSHDVIGDLQSLIVDEEAGTTAIDFLGAELQRLQKSGATRWGVISKFDAEGRSVRYLLSFTEAYERCEKLADRMSKKLMDDMRFFKKLVPFTNDPEQAAENYFPLHELGQLKTGSCEHWLRFETQIPPWGVETFRAAIYGIYDDRNKSRQILYLQDKGYSGKSNVANALFEVGGRGFGAAVSKEAIGNQFWGSKVYGKRFIHIPDSGNTKWSMTDKIKQLSGGDYIDVEAKGKPSFSYKPNVRLAITTNELPEINTSADNQVSRILLFPLTPNRDPEFVKSFAALDGNGKVRYNPDGKPELIGDANFERKLVSEIWDYLAICKPAYEKLCPNNSDLPRPKEMIEFINKSCRTDMVGTMSALLDEYLEVDEGKRISHKALQAVIAYAGLQEKEWEKQFREIKRELLNTYRGAVTDGGCSHSQRWINGIGLKPPFGWDGQKISKRSEAVWKFEKQVRES